jgi:hypothetical protein
VNEYELYLLSPQAPPWRVEGLLYFTFTVLAYNTFQSSEKGKLNEEDIRTSSASPRYEFGFSNPVHKK